MFKISKFQYYCEENRKQVRSQGMYIFFLNSSLLLKFFFFIRNVYISFSNLVHFLLFWKQVHNLLKISTFSSLFMRRASFQLKYTFFSYFKKVKFTFNGFLGNCHHIRVNRIWNVWNLDWCNTTIRAGPVNVLWSCAWMSKLFRIICRR